MQNCLLVAILKTTKQNKLVEEDKNTKNAELQKYIFEKLNGLKVWEAKNHHIKYTLCIRQIFNCQF